MDMLWGMIAEQGPDTHTDDLVKAGFLGFMKTWAESGGPDQDELDDTWMKRLGARHPMTCYEMLYHYVERRRVFFQSVDIIAIERPFVIPIDPGNPHLFYVGRLDKVVRNRRSKTIDIIEHKTTSWYSKLGVFNQNFLNSFSPNSQIDGYLVGGKSIYGDKLRAVHIDAALVHKKIHDGFEFIPISRATEQLEAWLWEARGTVARMESDEHALIGYRDAVAEDLVVGEHSIEGFLPSYPKDTNRCFDFMTPCSYLDMCRARANPETYLEPPEGFVEDEWIPFEVLGLADLFKAGKPENVPGVIGDTFQGEQG